MVQKILFVQSGNSLNMNSLVLCFYCFSVISGMCENEGELYIFMVSYKIKNLVISVLRRRFGAKCKLKLAGNEAVVNSLADAVDQLLNQALARRLQVLDTDSKIPISGGKLPQIEVRAFRPDVFCRTFFGKIRI